jgi:hypothetical protein
MMARTFPLLLLSLVPIVGAAAEGEVDLEDVMRRSFMVGKVVDSRAEVTMTLTNARGSTRERKTLTLSKREPNGIDQRRLIRFLAPAEVKGTATLLVEHSEGEDDIWIYLPALHKVRRLVANNKKDSFVGTDFSYGDVIGHRVEDWRYELVGNETVDGAATWVVDALPRDDDVREHSGYGRRRLWIRQDNFVAVRGRFWDPAGAALKELEASDVREIDPTEEKWQAFHLRMKNLQTQHVTVFQFDSLEVRQGLADALFSERYLEKEG